MSSGMVRPQLLRSCVACRGLKRGQPKLFKGGIGNGALGSFRNSNLRLTSGADAAFKASCSRILCLRESSHLCLAPEANIALVASCKPLHSVPHGLLPGSRPCALLLQIIGGGETLHQTLLLASLQGTGAIQPWVPGLSSLKDGDDSAKQQKNAEITPVQVTALLDHSMSSLCPAGLLLAVALMHD